jgi:RNA polymerase sigma factor (sigma-70 family)
MPFLLDARLWKLAIAMKDNKFPELSEPELLSLAYDALTDSMPRFDIDHPPKRGVANRRSTQDRVVYWFGRRLAWAMEHYRRELRSDTGRKGDQRYEGPQPHHQSLVREARQVLVWDALARLSEREQEIIFLRYWDGATLSEIALKLDMGNRSKAERALDRIHDKLRAIILAEVENALLDLGLSENGATKRFSEKN